MTTVPVAARPILTAAEAAIAAARRQDEAALTDAASALARLEQSRVGLVLGTTVRLLLEFRHPDDVLPEDVQAVLIEAVRGSAWHPSVEPRTMVYLLAGALGVEQDREAPPPAPEALATHAALLLTTLLGPGPAPVWFEAALEEIEKTQLND